MMPADPANRIKLVAVVIAVVAALALVAVVALLPDRDRRPDVPSQDLPPAQGRLVRGVYGRDTSNSGLDDIESTGFEAVTVLPETAKLKGLEERGLRGLVWLGAYDSSRCSFERDDRWVEGAVARVRDHPALLAYQIADEPNHSLCPEAPQQMKERAALVNSLDPAAPTYLTVPAWDGKEGYPYQHFAGSTDIMGLVVYPCLQKAQECWFKMIDRAIAEADRDGVGRYWAIIQNFETDWYRLPSEEELLEQYRRWNGSRMSGYFVYQWTLDSSSSPQRAEILARLNQQGSGG